MLLLAYCKAENVRFVGMQPRAFFAKADGITGEQIAQAVFHSSLVTSALAVIPLFSPSLSQQGQYAGAVATRTLSADNQPVSPVLSRF
jgi:hypothetical protein